MGGESGHATTRWKQSQEGGGGVAAVHEGQIITASGWRAGKMYPDLLLWRTRNNEVVNDKCQEETPPERFL